ncbi:hypothetical protein [Vibrio owensii]|uniref:hypothetical protein n=1 Tax=Vibrio owensii TaxID=696485 RepID=UPI0018F14EBB|nr:hypothetical protein [Vibrio owensii]
MRRMQHSYSQPKQANVKKIYEVSAFSAYSYADLLLNEKLLLLSLFISGDVNESGDIIPLRNWRGDAAWGGERMFYLREMIQKQVLVVSPNTPQMVFNGGRQARAEIGLCYWRMNIRSRGEQLTHHDLSRKLRYDVLIIGLPPEAKYVLAEMVVMQMIEQIIQSVLSSRFEDLKISTAFRLECKSLLRELPVGKVCSRVRSVCAAMINDVPKSLLTKELADELLRSRVRHVKTPDAWSAFTPSVLPVATKLVVESILKVSMKGFVTNTIAYSVVGDV